MKVLIVGGGIGGLSLGAALSRRGVACQIVEREPRWTTVGAGIAMYPNGVRALHRLGVGPAIEAAGAPIAVVRTLDRGGALLSEFPGEVWDGVGRTFAIHRAVLQRILVEAISDVPVRLGTTVAAIDATPQGVEVVLTDGSVERCDVLVGADGIRSQVRDVCLAPSPPRYVGQMYWRTAIAADVVAHATMQFDEHRYVAILPLGGGSTYVAYQLECAQAFDERLEGRVDRLRERFADFGGPAAEALALLGPDESVHFGPAEEIDRDQWRAGRVVLIGDAAHACSPTLAQGGSLAMEDAIVLAELLASVPVDHALDQFVARREPRARWVRERTHVQIRLLNESAAHEHLERGMRETYAVLAREI